jgi:hypothetical protein
VSAETPGSFNQNSTYGAEQLRRTISSVLARGSTVGSINGGLVGASDMQISAGGGMSVNVSTGEAWIPGSTSTTQGGYYGRVSSSTNLVVAASNPSNPRIDSVSATITDSAYSGVTNTFGVQVNTGTPTAGATLSNLNGAPSLPASSLLLGYILVPAASSSVSGGNISNVAVQVQLQLSNVGAWTALSLATNITSTGIYVAASRIEGTVVRLRGQLTNGTGSSDSGTLATIAVGAGRPPGTVNVGAGGIGVVNQAIIITSAGAISANGGVTNSGIVYLDGLTFTLS